MDNATEIAIIKIIENMAFLPLLKKLFLLIIISQHLKDNNKVPNKEQKSEYIDVAI